MALTRRRFLQLSAGSVAAAGASRFWVPEVANALLDPSKGNTPVIWLQLQACSGCSVSLLNATYPDIASTLLDVINLQYHPNVSAASGEQVLHIFERAEKELAGKFVLVVEGSIPVGADGLYCTIGEKDGKLITAMEWMNRLGTAAMAIIAVGACATFGGIPMAPPNPTGAKGVKAFLPGKTIINIPGCPSHPEDMIGTIAHVLLFGIPKLDEQNRPVFLFGPDKLIHDNCERRKYFDDGQFAKDFGDLATGHMCLYELGCRGPVTHSPCPQRRWNNATNWCIGAGAPCIGCFAPEFPGATEAAFYEKLPDVKLPGIRTSADKFGKVLGIATAAGIVGHAIGRMATSGKGKEG
jgi:hydrogenase small subunit